MAHKKTQLQQKTCLQCQRPFNWRKKWRLCWSEVKYCSKACSGLAASARKRNKATDNLCKAGAIDDEF